VTFTVHAPESLTPNRLEITVITQCPSSIYNAARIAQPIVRLIGLLRQNEQNEKDTNAYISIKPQ